VTAHVRWSAGGEAWVRVVRADAISLDSTVPSPPGSRIEGTVRAAPGQEATRIRVKVHASRRQPDGRFLLEGRPLDLSREARTALEALVLGAGPAHGE
jgi:hypothetical protein